MQVLWEIWDKISGYVIQYGMSIIYALLIFFIGKNRA